MRRYNIDGHVVNQYDATCSISDSFITCSNQNETPIPLAMALLFHFGWIMSTACTRLV